MSNNDDIRWRQRLEHFERACDRLNEAIDAEELSPLERTGLIKHYEMAFELAWKTLEDLLNFEGFEGVGSPKATLRTAHEAGWVDDIDTWISMLDARNRATHIYDEAEADSLVHEIRHAFAAELGILRDRLSAKERADNVAESDTDRDAE